MGNPLADKLMRIYELRKQANTPDKIPVWLEENNLHEPRLSRTHSILGTDASRIIALFTFPFLCNWRLLVNPLVRSINCLGIILSIQSMCFFKRHLYKPVTTINFKFNSYLFHPTTNHKFYSFVCMQIKA